MPCLSAPLLVYTFQVDLNLTKTLMDSPAGKEVRRRGILMTGESGIFTPDDVAFVQAVSGRR